MRASSTQRSAEEDDRPGIHEADLSAEADEAGRSGDLALYQSHADRDQARRQRAAKAWVQHVERGGAASEMARPRLDRVDRASSRHCANLSMETEGHHAKDNGIST